MTSGSPLRSRTLRCPQTACATGWGWAETWGSPAQMAWDSEFPSPPKERAKGLGAPVLLRLGHSQPARPGKERQR